MQVRTETPGPAWPLASTPAGGYLSPLRLVRSLYASRRLIGQFAWRDFEARYKGSYLGMVWSFVVPLIMLTVYGFVFSVIMHAKWGTSADQSKVDFALTLFAGLLAFNVFAEVVGRAPALVIGYPAYVKKVVFPLEILPVAALGTALANAVISLVILLPAWAVVHHTISSSIWLLPLALLPLCFLTLGLAWFIASLGVFMRDIAHPVGIIVQVLMFVSGVFFAISALPPRVQEILLLNPLVIIIENIRRTLIWGEPIHWRSWALVTVCCAALMQLGFAWFMRTKKAFADVI
jgi:homopolymeric O-antigen transport system permease protein